MTKNFILQDQSSIDRFQGSLLPVYCHGPLCKTFICHIDTLPIGHSVLIQLKASLRYNHLQSKLDRSKPFIIVSNASAQVREIPLKFSTTKSQQQPIAQLKINDDTCVVSYLHRALISVNNVYGHQHMTNTKTSINKFLAALLSRANDVDLVKMI
ncbi:unnamed protein product [Rotaria magnacalcarata]|uniref:Integrin alpha third immunoglobulin-like domain-containing protein n=1 Tax=Rotaria magnacalcarata TaxID=392030 RepID=A0A8S3I5U6_9BILA|nr:unnamed protein product [Rotaria magnacalcarata]